MKRLSLLKTMIASALVLSLLPLPSQAVVTAVRIISKYGYEVKLTCATRWSASDWQTETRGYVDCNFSLSPLVTPLEWYLYGDRPNISREIAFCCIYEVRNDDAQPSSCGDNWWRIESVSAYDSDNGQFHSFPGFVEKAVTWFN